MGLHRTLAILALIAFPAGAFAQHGEPGHLHRFTGAERWAQIFDDPAREAWQKPAEVIEALALDPRAVVADLGAGTGYFAVRLAQKLSAGKVYAADTEADMVAYLKERARREKRANMVAVKARPEDPKLPEKVDVVLLVDVYHHIGDRERYFRKLQGSLKPGGRVAIVDFHLDSPHGPPRSARIASPKVVAEMKAAGYRLQKEHGFLPHQYFLVFEPAP